MTDTADFHVPFRDVLLRGTVIHSDSKGEPRLMALHGGGSSSRQGYLPLLSSLARCGFSSVAFDFSSCGESSGELAGSSLDHRAQQALAVANDLKMQRPISMIASSMGGHIACALIDFFQPAALVLYCPAAYERAAEHLAFGPAFQEAIRATGCFDSSPAFDALERFSGKLLVVYGSEDSVIPKAVQHGYATRARRAKSVEVIRLAGAPHRLHAWLGDHPAPFSEVLERVVATLGSDS